MVRFLLDYFYCLVGFSLLPLIRTIGKSSTEWMKMSRNFVGSAFCQALCQSILLKLAAKALCSFLDTYTHTHTQSTCTHTQLMSLWQNILRLLLRAVECFPKALAPIKPAGIKLSLKATESMTGEGEKERAEAGAHCWGLQLRQKQNSLLCQCCRFWHLTFPPRLRVSREWGDVSRALPWHRACSPEVKKQFEIQSDFACNPEVKNS